VEYREDKEVKIVSAKAYDSVFDIPVKDQYGEPDLLGKMRGKILVFVNTTGECGNAPQWPVVDMLDKELESKGLEVIYVPTNDYCGSVTFNAHKDGIKDAKDSAEYARKTYGVEGIFTELLSSRNETWEYKYADHDGLTGEWSIDPDAIAKATAHLQAPKSDLFEFLVPEGYPELQGNFHKIITNTDGIPVAHFNNSAFLDFDLNIERGYALPVEEEVANFKAVIDEILATGDCNHPRYAYHPQGKPESK
jgi:glutathione peroxidase-family protein